MVKCVVCKKEALDKNLVWYSMDDPETYLCKDHKKEWNKQNKILENKYGDCGGNSKLCRKFGVAYFKWINSKEGS